MYIVAVSLTSFVVQCSFTPCLTAVSFRLLLFYRFIEIYLFFTLKKWLRLLLNSNRIGIEFYQIYIELIDCSAYGCCNGIKLSKLIRAQIWWLGIIDPPILRGLPKYRKFYTRRCHYHELITLLRPYIFIFFSRGYFRWFHPNALKRINIHRIFHQSQTEPVWIEWEHLFLVYLDMVGSSPVFSHFHSKCNCCLKVSSL